MVERFAKLNEQEIREIRISGSSYTTRGNGIIVKYNIYLHTYIHIYIYIYNNVCMYV